MQKGLLSIILPFYNSEKYIKETIERILKSTYKDIEIIAIDDGSEDKSKKIVEEMQDDRIKIYSQKNKGVSAARNIGISLAKGEYITFVDADDLVERNMYEVLINKIKDNNVDVGICNYKLINEEGRIIEKRLSKNFEIKMNKKNFLNNINKLSMYQGFVWNKIYRANVIKNIKFDENIYVLEDLLFNFEIALYNKDVTFFYIDEPLYLYRINESSVLHTSKINHKIISTLNSLENIIKIAEKIKLNSEEFSCQYVYNYNYYLCNMDKKARKEFTKKYKRMYRIMNRRIKYFNFKYIIIKLKILRYKIKNICSRK